jgi:hypothetical protein
MVDFFQPAIGVMVALFSGMGEPVRGTRDVASASVAGSQPVGGTWKSTARRGWLPSSTAISKANSTARPRRYAGWACSIAVASGSLSAAAPPCRDVPGVRPALGVANDAPMSLCAIGRLNRGQPH